MSLVHNVVFALLMFQSAVFLLVTAPLPFAWRRMLLMSLGKTLYSPRVRYYFNIILVFVGILFVDSAVRLYSIKQEVAAVTEMHGHGHMNASMHHSKLFYTQRNLYLTGVTLLLTRFQNVLVDLIRDNKKLTEQLAAVTETHDAEAAGQRDFAQLKLQAKRSNDAYLELSDKYLALEKQVRLAGLDLSSAVANASGSRDDKKDM
ncbi:hypothetical protein CXG81DRAFT_8582 [Caulochytrium protostelioides]|uniref:Endoplasmic reticulum transmembrane protein n=1 Tax=Caulochytrium protostelioides TaxID=1555241 RepID=A0A4P9XF92_9FUNG|nr:hypothetical protein CXG81DRAFT_8582 [Caulochytrium protostelioides]|eukprot:RKP04253.1 hypothetical protein CXG81DRAFT_8582 [Caulochytrium protostelioides]